MMQIGDQVRWTNISRSRRTISMALKEGVIESIENDVATVRYGKQSRKQIHVTRLSLRGQPTDIDRALQAIREASV